MPPARARLEFILSEQQHCDHYLSPLADPSGRSVLVAGCGAGTEMLWCLRRGAREVVGVDLASQDSTALERAVRQFEIAPEASYSIHQLPMEEVGTLGRKFDLVLSNNVFEHVSRLEAALTACLRALEPRWGRLVIFSAPLFYSSSGSHLVHEPWEHLWADGEELRRRLLARGETAPPALAQMPLERYFDAEITLNRLRLSEFLDAVARLGAVAHKLGTLPDRCIHRFAEFEPRIRARLGERISTLDLTTEGLFAELGPATADRSIAPVPSTDPVEAGETSSSARGALGPTDRELEARVVRESERSALLLARYHEVLGLLRAVEASPTFRAARLFSSRLKRLARW
jgi:SAM-dependent methyltransferase